MGELKPCHERQFLRGGWDLVTSDSAPDIGVFWLQGMVAVGGEGRTAGQMVPQRVVIGRQTLHSVPRSISPPPHDSIPDLTRMFQLGMHSLESWYAPEASTFRHCGL